MKLRAAVVALAVLAALGSPARAQTKEQCINAFEDGQVLRDQLRLRAAREKFALCARDACASPLRADCAENLDRLARDTPTLLLGARDEEGRDVSGVRIFVDDEPAPADDSGRNVPVDPGPHVVRFEHPNYPTEVERIVVHVGERNRALVATLHAPKSAGGATAMRPTDPLPPPPRDARASAGPSPWAFVMAAVALVGAGSFAAFAVAGKSEKDRLQTACAPACTDAEVATLKTRYIAADVSLGVGIVAAGIATFLFASAPSSAPPSAASR